jgi:hypothetical protein
METMSYEREELLLPETVSGPRPGDFPVGSIESRAAARAMLKGCDITTVVIMTGLPHSFQGPPIINPPDSAAYYMAADDSIVEVVCREYERGKFTAFIDQTWTNGSLYDGNCRVRNFADLQKLWRPQRTSR